MSERGKRNQHEWDVVAQWVDENGQYCEADYCELCKRYQINGGSYLRTYKRQYDNTTFQFAMRYASRKDIPAAAFDHPNDFDLDLRRSAVR